MEVQVIQVPYDSAHRNLRMGQGPQHFIEQGAARFLEQRGHQVQVSCIESENAFRAEIATAFELYSKLAESVRSAVLQRRFPLVLSGNCSSCIGTLAGITSAAPVGIVWFDGHGDFDTPETSVTGFLDGMGIAMATGRCWKAMLHQIPGFRPAAEENVVVVGAREFDPEELADYQRSSITLIHAERIRQEGIQAPLEPVLKSLQSRVEQIYLHIDLDVLDPQEAKANEFAPPDGLTVSQVESAIQMLQEYFTIAAAGLASYDPAYDDKAKTFQAGVCFMNLIARNHEILQ